VFSAALDASSSEEPQLADFTMYRPSFNAPAAFVATPVEDEGQRIGVLVVDDDETIRALFRRALEGDR